MKKSLLSVIALGVLGGLFLAGNSWGQFGGVVQPPKAGNTRNLGIRPDPNTPANRSEKPVDIGSGFGGGSSGSGLPGGGGGVPAPPTIEQLMSRLREEDDDAKKAGIMTLLQAAVVTSFDEDMKSRETELTKLEERLTKLRVQLDRRRKAKAEIIQLHLKVMVNEADGLGFSGASVFDFEPSSTPGNTGGFSDELLVPLSRKW